jgi:hypothetical protein
MEKVLQDSTQRAGNVPQLLSSNRQARYGFDYSNKENSELESNCRDSQGIMQWRGDDITSTKEDNYKSGGSNYMGVYGEKNFEEVSRFEVSAEKSWRYNFGHKNPNPRGSKIKLAANLGSINKNNRYL